MAKRNARGQFITEAQARREMGEQVIEENVREAIEILRRGLYRNRLGSHVEADHRHMAERFLLHAAHAAEPLLRADR